MGTQWGRLWGTGRGTRETAWPCEKITTSQLHFQAVWPWASFLTSLSSVSPTIRGREERR